VSPEPREAHALARGVTAGARRRLSPDGDVALERVDAWRAGAPDTEDALPFEPIGKIDVDVSLRGPGRRRKDVLAAYRDARAPAVHAGDAVAIAPLDAGAPASGVDPTRAPLRAHRRGAGLHDDRTKHEERQPGDRADLETGCLDADRRTVGSEPPRELRAREPSGRALLPERGTRLRLVPEARARRRRPHHASKPKPGWRELRRARLHACHGYAGTAS